MTGDAAADTAGQSWLRVSGLTKTFSQVQAVSEAHLSAGRGETLILMGPSGSGKTTFLRLIAGLERPDSGTIYLSGRLLSCPDWLAPPWERRIGMVFQADALFPHLGVREQIFLGKDREDNPHRDDLVKALKINDLYDRLPHQLSGGEAKRVALARTLMIPADLYLFDEPFAHLDEKARKEISLFLRDFLKQERRTALIVTHETDIAQSLEFPIYSWSGGKVVPS